MSWEVYLILSISKDRGPRPGKGTCTALEDAGLIIVSQRRVLAILLDCLYLFLRFNQNREDPRRPVFPVQNVILM
ncbi:MAG: hypothetical protein CL401_02810 [Acidiferrobacteraceae bacterium]|nr:hypothetical protein [Acidiferrobacteraceae bacterium]